MKALSLEPKHWQKMREHAQALAPMEACGLLAGAGAEVKEVLLIRNSAQSNIRFVMDPAEQVKAFNWIEAQGLDLLAIFHSHPQGPEGPSATDLEEAAYEVVYIVLSRPHGIWQTRGYWIQGSQADEVSLSISGNQ